jgi:aspartate 1-decarboxylase
VQRIQLKSKIHRANITDANVNYEGSITIPIDLMNRVGLWEGEKVIPGKEGSGAFVVNGAAAHLINKGHCVTIMAWGIDSQPVLPKRILLDTKNQVVNDTVL